MRVNWRYIFRKHTGQVRSFGASVTSTRYCKMNKIEDIRIEPCIKSKYVQPYRVLYKQNGMDVLWDCVKMHDSLAILIYNKTRNAFVIVKQFRPAVYMSKNRPMWENSTIFPNALSQKPSSSTSDELPTHSPKKQKLHNDDSSQASAVQASSQPLDRASSTPTWGPGEQGCTYELCAGLVDKDLPLESIAKEEILEETGYDVPLGALERINCHCSNIGTAGTQQFLFFCEVTDDMLTGGGGGNTLEGEKIDVIYIPLEKSIEIVFDDDLAKSSSLCFGFFWFDKYKRSHYST